MAVFVLVHGAWHGGWCWRSVAAALRSAGHTVFCPTLTGLAERRHLLTAEVGLDTFVTDVASLIEWEELEGVVLVGHSFGGAVVAGVADRLPGRVDRLLFLDALVIDHGERPCDRVPPDVWATRVAAARALGDGLTLPVPPPAAFGVFEAEQTAWLERRLTPHPLKSYTDPLLLARPLGAGLPVAYVASTDPVYAPLASARAFVRSRGWLYREIATGHDLMVTAPAETARLLLDLCR